MKSRGDEKLSQEISFTDGSFAGREGSLDGLERWFEEITIYPRTCSILEHDTMVSIFEGKLRVVYPVTIKLPTYIPLSVTLGKG